MNFVFCLVPNVLFVIIFVFKIKANFSCINTHNNNNKTNKLLYE
jgi:hypothetical protein